MNARDWALNANTMNLREGVDLYVPPAWSTTERYCATLGHKANHAFAGANAKYDVYDHPRFGALKCILTMEPVPAGEEILVTYGYELGTRLGARLLRATGGTAACGAGEGPVVPADCPPWYREALERHLRARGVYDAGEGA